MMHTMKTTQLPASRSASRPHTGARLPSARVGTPASSIRRNVRASAGFEDLINSLTVAINKSPLAEGKKALAIAQAGNYDVDATKAQLDKYISDNDVLVFSWTTCPFCVKAKGLLTDLGVKYTAVELNTMPEGNAIRAELAKLTGRTSMPNIFIKGQGVGGCNDGPGVMTLHRENKLVPMLKEAGAL